MSQRRIGRTLRVHRTTVKRAIATRAGPRYERPIRLVGVARTHSK